MVHRNDIREWGGAELVACSEVSEWRVKSKIIPTRGNDRLWLDKGPEGVVGSVEGGVSDGAAAVVVEKVDGREDGGVSSRCEG